VAAIRLASAVGLAFVSACATPAPPPREGSGPSQLVFAFESEGNVRVFDSHGVGRAQEAALVAEGLTNLAARELSCPATAVALEELARVACTRQWVAKGCGRRASYLVIDDEGPADRVPEHPWVVLADTAAIVPMSAERDAAVGQFLAFLRGIGVKGQCADEADRYFELQAWGSRDLACPRPDVLPLRFSRGAMAEGCGKRATYWGSRLACVVDAPSDAPR
jgi:hypothetical protein